MEREYVAIVVERQTWYVPLTAKNAQEASELEIQFSEGKCISSEILDREIYLATPGGDPDFSRVCE